MKINARIQNSRNDHQVILQTDDSIHSINIPPKASGFGSSANGGELLLLAVATCYCNDIYREAAHRKLAIDSVEVTVSGEFGKEGEPARNINYKVAVQAGFSQQEILALIDHVDKIAEIHNTLRRGINVSLINSE